MQAHCWRHTILPLYGGQELKECVAELVQHPQLAKGGNAPIYGMAAALPDRSIVGEFLTAFQDAQLQL